MVLKLRPVVTMAGIDHILGGQDGRVVKVGAWLWEVLTIKLRGIEPGRILTHKKSIGWADGTEVTSRRYYGWHRPHYLGQQDGLVVKAPSFGGERTKYTPDMRRFESCCQKSP